jgi:hypothetical protein
MKKILALTAVAALFTGCDFAGGADGPAVTFSNITVSGLQIAADVTPVIEIQDIGGRSYFRADVTDGAALGSFEIASTQRDLFVVLLDRDAADSYSFVGVSPAFRAGEMTGDASLAIARRNGDVIGTAMLDIE